MFAVDMEIDTRLQPSSPKVLASFFPGLPVEAFFQHFDKLRPETTIFWVQFPTLPARIRPEERAVGNPITAIQRCYDCPDGSLFFPNLFQDSAHLPLQIFDRLEPSQKGLFGNETARIAVLPDAGLIHGSCTPPFFEASAT